MPQTILVVEDEPNIVESLSFLMKKAGFIVRVARDGNTAIRTIETEAPDLVLLDIMMPRRDGYEVCRTIRANPDWDDVRIIMLSAEGRDLDRRKGLELGADDYMTRPFSFDELEARIEGALRRAREAREAIRHQLSMCNTITPELVSHDFPGLIAMAS